MSTVVADFASALLAPFETLFNWLGTFFDYLTTTIDSLLMGFKYILSSGQNVLFYNSYVPALFGGVVVATVVVAVVKAIFGR